MRMRKLYAFAVVLLLAAPQVSHAVGSFSLFASDVISATTGLSSQSSVAKSSGLTFETVTVGTVALALELEELGTNMQSPHHNVLLLSVGAEQDVTGGPTLGAVQQTAGAGNVTLSLNSIVTSGFGMVAGTMQTHAYGTIGSAQGVGPELAFTLMMLNNPAFAVLNSFPVAQMLLVKQAVTSVASAPSPASGWSGMAIAMDILNVGVSEFSPHHNVATIGSAMQTAVATSGYLNATQQQIGVGNVQAAINQISIVTGSISATTGLITAP